MVLFLCIYFLNGFGSTQKIKVLKFAHVLDVNHPVHKSTVFMTQKMVEKSGGGMRVDIYSGGQLGAEREQYWLQEAVDESVIYHRKLWKGTSDEALRKVQKAGVEIIYPDKRLFRKKVKACMSHLAERLSLVYQT